MAWSTAATRAVAHSAARRTALASTHASCSSPFVSATASTRRTTITTTKGTRTITTATPAVPCKTSTTMGIAPCSHSTQTSRGTKRRAFHIQSVTAAPRHRPRFASTLSAKEDINPFGRFSRVVPTSLKLGVDSPNVNSLVPPHIGRPHYALKGNPSEWAVGIPIHTAESIQGCREAGQLAKEILELGGSLVQPGISTDEIDRILHGAIIARNAYPSPLNYMGFPKSICTSVSNVIAHGIPDHRVLEDGDIINIDITVYLNGYHGDTSATFLVGNVDQPGRDLVQRTKEALDEAIAICRPGVAFNQIGKTIQAVADKYGYTISQQFSGHGIGKEFHCLPLIFHHDNDEEGEMDAGMIFTIEPMFCQGSAVGVQWPDRWTVSTADGGRSAQWEHTVLVTEDGAERLTG